jgi:hypothetical protein
MIRAQGRHAILKTQITVSVGTKGLLRLIYLLVIYLISLSTGENIYNRTTQGNAKINGKLLNLKWLNINEEKVYKE